LTAPGDPAGRVLFALAAVWAAVGGLALVAIACLTTANIVLRAVFAVHIRGEFEIANLGVVMVVFMFMPLAQLTRSYVIVDIFTHGASVRTKTMLDALAGIVFAICMGLIAWRMLAGGIDIASSGDQTTMLHLRYWWGFAVGVPSLVLLTVACLYTAWSDFHALKR
jgi:TRAP-type C4-dicarboxylate transport system permease small subunit